MNETYKTIWIIGMVLIMMPLVLAEPIAENTEVICNDDLCTTTIYSFDKYWMDGDAWKEIHEPFDTKGCGAYAICTMNKHGFFMSSLNTDVLYKSQEHELDILLDNVFSIDTGSATLTYQDNVATYNGAVVDVVYTYTWAGVESEIVVSEKQTIQLLTDTQKKIQYKLDSNYKYLFNLDKELLIYDGSDVIGLIQPFTVYDSNNIIIDLYDLQIKKQGLDNFLEVEINKTKLLDSKVEYPIYIDPPIIFEDTPAFDVSLVRDVNAIPFTTYVRTEGRRIKIGADSDCDSPAVADKVGRGLLEWNLSTIPPNATITDMYINVTMIDANVPAQLRNVTSHHMEQDHFDQPNNATGNEHLFKDTANGTVYGQLNFTGSDLNVVRTMEMGTESKDDAETYLNNSVDFFAVGVVNIVGVAGQGENFCGGEKLNVGSNTQPNSTRRPLIHIEYLEDSCIYDSGNWTVRCDDACKITDDVVVDTNGNVTVNGNGTFIIDGASVNNFANFQVWVNSPTETCDIIVQNSGELRGQ